MPLRSAPTSQNDRPSSAIYIGNASINASSASSASSNTSTTPTFNHIRTPSTSSTFRGLPDLPEPPSPVLSNGSMSSGLPSPPATNSTGSGSAGDPSTIAVRRPAAYMRPNRSNSRLSYHATGVEGELDPDGNDVLDEDSTARFQSAGLRRHAAAASSSGENVAALQRVKSLADRNKLALDKLTLMARMASPTPPSVSNRHVRSATSHSKPSTSSPAAPPPQRSPSSTSARALQRSSLPPPPTPQDQILSGSETEREFVSSAYANSISSVSSSTSHSLSSFSSSSSSTPPSIVYNLPHAHTPTHNATNAYQTPFPSKHHRLTSLASVSTPYLPSTSRASQTPPPHAQPLSKTRSTGAAGSTGSGGSGGVSRTRMASVSTSSMSGSSSNVAASIRSREDAHTRGSAGSPKRRRRSGSGGNALSTLPLQPQNANSTSEEMRSAASSRRNTLRDGGEDVVQAALAAVASSRSRNSLDIRRRDAFPKEFERVVVEDDYPPDPVTPYRSNSTTSQWRSIDRDVLTRDRERERQMESRQSIRGGSAESALTSRGPGRNVASEVLKVVGLSPRRNRVLERAERERSADADVFARDRESGPISEFGERRARRDTMVPRSATSMSHRRYTSRSRSRAGMSDAVYSDEEDEVMRTAPAGLRSYRNVQVRPRENDVVLLPQTKRDRGREKEEERVMITGRSMTSMGRYPAFSTPVHQVGSSSSITAPQQDRHSATIRNGRSASAQVILNHTGGTTTEHSERAASRIGSLASLERTEHMRLMSDSLAMFEGHMGRILSGEGMGLSPAHVAELVKTAQGLVSSADRLNVLMRGASKHAVEMEIDAEVAGDVDVVETEGRGTGIYSARDMVHVWKRVNADYKEGVKASDDLVRGVTSFLLGIGKVMKDLGSGDGSSVVSGSVSGSSSSHVRSVSLNDEDIIIRSNRGSSPALSGGSGGLNTTAARRSIDVSRKREPSIASSTTPREEALKRLTGGTPSVRTSSSVLSRERDQDVRYESPLTASSVQPELPFVTPAPSRSSILSGHRRLLTPREQREQEQEQRMSRRMSYSEDVVASTSQDTITPYDPSPSPAPRNRNKPLPPLSIPRSLPSAASTSSYQANGTHDQGYSSPEETSSDRRGREMRKASNTSISTVRGSSTYPTALQPTSRGATTAVTTHTVSNASPPASASSSSLLSNGSRRNTQSGITFSKPSTESVPTLAGLQLQYEERQRTGEAKALPIPPSTPMSGSETERPPKRQTWGARTGQVARPEGYNVDDGRVSLGRAADRSAASVLLPHLNSNLSLGSAKKERRPVTDLFPKS